MKILQDALTQLNGELEAHNKKHKSLLGEIERAQSDKAEATARLDELIARRDTEYMPELVRINTEISQVARANGGRSLFDGKGAEGAPATQIT